MENYILGAGLDNFSIDVSGANTKSEFSLAPEGTVESEESTNTVATYVTDETIAKEAQAKEYNRNLVAPETTVIAPPIGSKGITAQEAEERVAQKEVDDQAKMLRFQQNQSVDMNEDTILRAAVLGQKKGFTAKQTEQKLRKAGYQVTDGMVRDILLQQGLKIGKLDETTEKFGIPTDDTGVMERAGNQIKLMGNEIVAGVTSLTNERGIQNEALESAKLAKEKETAWKNKNSSLDDQGELIRPWNVSGGVAEVGAYAALGVATGGISNLPTAGLKTAALADFIVSSSVDTARYLGTPEDQQSSEGYAVNIVANALGFGMTRYLTRAKPNVALATADENKAFINASTEQKAFAVEFYNWAESNNIKLFDSDFNEWDTTMNMFLTEAKKNFTTASVVADNLEGNIENLTKAVHKTMGNMPKAKELTPSMSSNIKQSLFNVETDLDNKISQAYKELDELDPKTARVPGDVLLDDYKFSDSYRELSSTKTGRAAIKEAEDNIILGDIMYSPSTIYNANKSVKNMAYDPSLSRDQRRAYIELSKYLDDRMDKLAQLQGNGQFIEQLDKAKSLAKDKGRIFGFDDSGKNADVANIPKLLAESNPDNVIKTLLSDPYTFEAVNNLLPASVKTDLQNFVKGGLLQQNTKQGKVGSASMVDFNGLAKDINKIDTRTMVKLFGEEEALNMKFVASVSDVLGKQANMEMAGGNVLGAMSEKGRAVSAIKGGPGAIASYFLQLLGSRKSVQALMVKDRVKLKLSMDKLTKELDSAGIRDRKGLINTVVNSIDELDIVKRTPKTKEDFGPISGVNVKSPTEVANEIKLSTKETKAEFTQISQDYSKLNSAITARNRVTPMDEATRDKYNKLRSEFTEAKYRGDIEAMADALYGIKQMNPSDGTNSFPRGGQPNVDPSSGGLGSPSPTTSATAQIESFTSGGLPTEVVPSRTFKSGNMPSELQNNVYTEDALSTAENLTAAQSKSPTSRTAGGFNEGSRTANPDYIRGTSVPNDAYEINLTKAQVKRIRAGKGTDADYEDLALDVDRIEADSNRLYEAEGNPFDEPSGGFTSGGMSATDQIG